MLLPSNQQTGSAPLVGCPRLLIHHIRSNAYRDTDTGAGLLLSTDALTGEW